MKRPDEELGIDSQPPRPPTELRITQGVSLVLEAVVLAVTDHQPRLLTLPESTGPALPAGPLLTLDRTLELGVRRLLDEQTNIPIEYVEQLYTFGDAHRYPSVVPRNSRQVGVAYLALTKETGPVPIAKWTDLYRLLPWEDHRSGIPEVLEQIIKPHLLEWAGDDPDRRERIQITFGLDETLWDGVRVLERYELLFEAGLVAEASRDRSLPAPARQPLLGVSMTGDHRRITATALGRLRGKLTYRPVVFELLETEFSLTQLQQLVESLSGRRIRTQNFRRLLATARLVETTPRTRFTGGRPARLYRFRREVLRERIRVGMGSP